MINSGTMKVCVVASGGGHLIQAMKLLPILKGHEPFLITFRTKHLKKTLEKQKAYYLKDPRRSVSQHLKNIPKIFGILRKERPKLVISTGAGIAVPVCLMAKYLFGAKFIFIESFSRVSDPSVTGRIMYRFADLFLVQWRSLLKKYGDKAVYGGSLL